MKDSYPTKLMTIRFFSSNDDENPPTRRKVERSSSTRLQNAAKLLRTLSKSRLTKESSSNAIVANAVNSAAEESKGANHETKAKKRSHSFHAGRNSEQKKLQRKESAAAAAPRSVSTDWKR